MTPDDHKATAEIAEHVEKSGSAISAFPAVASLRAQRFDGIDPRRAPRPNLARRIGDEREDHGRPDEAERIGLRNLPPRVYVCYIAHQYRLVVNIAMRKTPPLA